MKLSSLKVYNLSFQQCFSSSIFNFRVSKILVAMLSKNILETFSAEHSFTDAIGAQH